MSQDTESGNVPNTSCCIRINVSGQVGKSTQKCKEKVTWFPKVNHDGPCVFV